MGDTALCTHTHAPQIKDLPDRSSRACGLPEPVVEPVDEQVDQPAREEPHRRHGQRGVPADHIAVARVPVGDGAADCAGVLVELRVEGVHPRLLQPARPDGPLVRPPRLVVVAIRVRDWCPDEAVDDGAHGDDVLHADGRGPALQRRLGRRVRRQARQRHDAQEGGDQDEAAAAPDQRRQAGGEDAHRAKDVDVEEAVGVVVVCGVANLVRNAGVAHERGQSDVLQPRLQRRHVSLVGDVERNALDVWVVELRDGAVEVGGTHAGPHGVPLLRQAGRRGQAEP
mmetsp:Transcript_38932/g.130219  ORF Transcript_38932/g.130219 Transcript_38932/m.130219 type:complete len:283 (-) Transcript_38932:363-1211(-)